MDRTAVGSQNAHTSGVGTRPDRFDVTYPNYIKQHLVTSITCWKRKGATNDHEVKNVSVDRE